MAKTKIYAIVCAACCFAASAVAVRLFPQWILPKAKITVKVVGEDRKPVANVQVRAGFVLPYNGWTDSFKGYSLTGTTNQDGFVSFEGKTTREISLSIQPEGCYKTIFPPYLFKEVKGGKWQPWNFPVELVLKPILNPIPMYARKVYNVKIPVLDYPVGFDLSEGDWVAPHGKGKVPDFIFTLKKHYTSVDQPFEVTLALRFGNDGDGIQSVFAPINAGSELRLPRDAPENGYLSELTVTARSTASGKQ